MKVLNCILLLLLGLPSIGQTDKEQAEFRVMFNLDFKRTVVRDNAVNFYGFRLGAQKEKNIIAVGFYGLASAQVYEDQPINRGADTTDLSLDIDFAMLTYERVFLETNKWQIAGPIGVGIGNVRTRMPDENDVFKVTNEREAFIFEYGVKVSYELLFWLHAQGGVGNRHVFTRDPLTDKTYTGFTWVVGVGIKTGEILKHWKSKRNNGDS